MYTPNHVDYKPLSKKRNSIKEAKTRGNVETR